MKYKRELTPEEEEAKQEVLANLRAKAPTVAEIRRTRAIKRTAKDHEKTRRKDLTPLTSTFIIHP